MSDEATAFVLGWIARMSERFGAVVWDTEDGRALDWGQALVREAYGPDWLWEEVPASPTKEVVEIAMEWEEGEWPSWADTYAEAGEPTP